jgi:hypothetical protein
MKTHIQKNTAPRLLFAVVLFCCFLLFSACEPRPYNDPRPTAGTMTLGDWVSREDDGAWHRLDLAVPGIYELTISDYNANQGSYMGTPTPVVSVYPENADHFKDGTVADWCLLARGHNGFQTTTSAYLPAGGYYVVLSDSGRGFFGTLTLYRAMVSLATDIEEEAAPATFGTPIELAQDGSDDSKWFFFDLTEQHQAALSVAATADDDISALLYGRDRLGNALYRGETGNAFGTLPAGRYYLHVETSATGGTVLLSDFSPVLPGTATFPIGKQVNVPLVGAAGVFLPLVLTQPAVLQLCPQQLDGLTVNLFSSENLSVPLTSRTFSGTTNQVFAPIVLPPQSYYIYLAHAQAPDSGVTVPLSVIDLSPVFASAPSLTVGVPARVAPIPESGTWHVLDIPAPIALERIASTGLSLTLFTADMIPLPSDALCAAPAGRYYVWLVPTAKEPVTGHVLFRDVAAVAKKVKVRLSKRKFTAEPGAWFALTVKRETRVNIRNAQTGVSRHSENLTLYAATDFVLDHGVSIPPTAIGRNYFLQPGTYYIKVDDNADPFLFYVRHKLFSLGVVHVG